MLPKACSGASCCRQKQAGGEGRGLLLKATVPGQITALRGLALCLGCSEKPRPTQLPAHASFYSPYPLLSLGAGGQPSARLFMFFFLSFSMRINLLSVDCETVLQTESYRSCGFFIATSIFQVDGLQLGQCPELALLAWTELNPNCTMLETRMQGWRPAQPPPWHDVVSSCLVLSVRGKGKHVAGRRQTQSKENQFILLNYD